MAGPIAFDTISATLICATLSALQRNNTPAKTFGAGAGPRGVVCNAAQATQLSAARPDRIGVAFQCPAGTSGNFGDRQTVQNILGGSGPMGFFIPAGGGWVFGPEYVGDLWFILTVGQSPATVTVLELISAA